MPLVRREQGKVEELGTAKAALSDEVPRLK